MNFYGFTSEQLASAADALDYPAGVYFSETGKRGRMIRGVLRVRNSRAEGARLSASGRHTAAASWEAHRDFMSALFKLNPEGRIQSMLADYRGAEDFEQKFPGTHWHQVGSQYRPAAFGDLSV